MSEMYSDTGSVSDDQTEHDKSQIFTVYLRESDVFGWRKPGQPMRWLEHSEIYLELEKLIDRSHITGLQRIRGMWRMHFSNIEDKVEVMASAVHLRGKKVSVLSTFPTRLDGERTTRLRVKNIPLTIDDDEIIKRTFTLKGIEVISMYRERLVINGNMTTCENGDRIVIVSSASLKEPLPKFTDFGKYSAHVIMRGQLKDVKAGATNVDKRPRKCSKCLLDGHTFSNCPNDWVCHGCFGSHRKSECPYENDTDSDDGAAETQSGSVDESTKSYTTEVHAQGYTSNASDGHKLVSSPTPSAGVGRGALLQKSMGDFLITHATPNKDKPPLVKDRSPPTPVEEYREKCDSKTTQKHQRKK